MSEVSAVVLTVGEPYVQRALDSLAAQTIPLRTVVMVEHVSPFSRAINQGARQVDTLFFVQVDADMILDPACVETLLAAMRPDTGIVVGELRDALAGRAIGAKLFRTACFRQAAMPDSIAQDSDFGARLHRQGWQTVYLRASGGDPSTLPPAVGEHRPDYTPTYTYRKLVVEGARLRHRAARHGLFSRMADLEQSAHPLATLAQLALGHGFFLPSMRDELKPLAHDPRAEWLTTFLASGRVADEPPATLLRVARHARLREVFGHFLEAGRSLAASDAGGSFAEIFAGLPGTRRDPRALVAKVALGHGLLMDADDLARLPRDEADFGRFMVYSLGRRAGLLDHVRARAAHLLGRHRRSRSYVPW